ncbi:protein O-mannosyl-transferase 1 isoform X1 [Stigmatopora argus]
MVAQRLPLVVQTHVDLLMLFITLLAFWTRMGCLAQPNAIVFDEVYYGHFVSLYMKRIFFIDDSGPPLGHMILALGAYLGEFDGNFTWNGIGAEYPCGVSVWSLRAVPATCGALCVPLAYCLTLELGFGRTAAAGAALLLLLDNALIVQSRLMLLESVLIFFVLAAFLSYLRFRRVTGRWPARYAWLLLSGMFCAGAIGVKYVGIFSYLLLVCVAGVHCWKLIGETRVRGTRIIAECFGRGACLLSFPVALYVVCFYTHLMLLYRSGPHDHMMSPAFQASLQGGLARITLGQPLEVAYGSQVTLRSAASRPIPCWLQSRKANYPVRYDSGRGSSHQQQVTCHHLKDVNNWWIVKNPSRAELSVGRPPHVVRHGDVVQLLHGMTSRFLNSHDVAAPLSPHAQEVSGYVDFNVSMHVQNLWKVDIINRVEDSQVWKTIVSEVRLVHVNTSAILKLSGSSLPDWAEGHAEVVADKVKGHKGGTTWTVEEHRYGTGKEREPQLYSSTSFDVERRISLWSKFIELQWRMLTVKQEDVEHKYSSTPLEWLTMDSNIVYWLHPCTNAQIHLIGNPLLWGVAKLSLLTYLIMAAIYLFRRRRGIIDLTDDVWERFVSVGVMCVGGWLFNFAPFVLTDKRLFLYHYLPALVFLHLLGPVLLEHLHAHVLSKDQHRLMLLVCAWAALACAFLSYCAFRPLTYGSPELSADGLRALKWRRSWDILYRWSESPERHAPCGRTALLTNI